MHIWLIVAHLDNVGGEILDFMLTRLAKYGRVAAWYGFDSYNPHTEI